MFCLQLSGSHTFGWLASSDGLFCSEILFGFGIVPRPSVLSESVEFPQCHSSSFFFCNQDCLPRSFRKQLFITRVETTAAVRNYPVHPHISLPCRSYFGKIIHQKEQKHCTIFFFLPAIVYGLLMKDVFKGCPSEEQRSILYFALHFN